MAASDWWPQIRSEIGLHPLATLRRVLAHLNLGNLAECLLQVESIN